MTPASENRLKKVHPELAKRVRMIIETLAQSGMQIEVVQGLRTFAEQDAIFAQGRTRPGIIVTKARGGQSNHNFGLAADLVPYTDGKANWKAPNSIWVAIGAEAEKVGLQWGGNWKKFIDRPHVQLPGLTTKQCLALFQKGGLEAVWAAASRAIASLPAIPTPAPTTPPAVTPTPATGTPTGTLAATPTPPAEATIIQTPTVIVTPVPSEPGAPAPTVIVTPPAETTAPQPVPPPQPAPPPKPIPVQRGKDEKGISLNDRGDSVRLIQTRLAALGFLGHGDIDGIFGKGTQAAIKKFQASKGLTADGVVGPNTRVALMS